MHVIKSRRYRVFGKKEIIPSPTLPLCNSPGKQTFYYNIPFTEELSLYKLHIFVLMQKVGYFKCHFICFLNN